jgi:hypothetical protein
MAAIIIPTRMVCLTLFRLYSMMLMRCLEQARPITTTGKALAPTLLLPRVPGARAVVLDVDNRVPGRHRGLVDVFMEETRKLCLCEHNKHSIFQLYQLICIMNSGKPMNAQLSVVRRIHLKRQHAGDQSAEYYRPCQIIMNVMYT